MASKKSRKSIKPVAIDQPSYSSKIKDGDVVLVNRNKVDNHTKVEDLAQYVGAELEIDQLVVDINQEIGDSVTNIGQDLTELEAKVDANKIEIDAHTEELEDLSDQVEQNKNDIASNTADIKVNAGNIADNSAAITALEADQERQNSWTGIPAGSNSDSSATLDARIADNAAEIAKLQGALVYRGVGDFSNACPFNTTGDFVLSTQTGNVTGSGWTGLSSVKDQHYYAFNGSNWEEAGSNSVEMPEVNDGALVIQPQGTASGVTVTNGTGFSANSKGNITTELKLDLNNEGGLELTDDGLGIKGGDGLIVDGGGIAVDPNYISSNAGAKDGSLTIKAGDGVTVADGTGFSANTDSDVTTEVSLDLNDEGGLEVTDDGLGIAPKPDSGIIVDGDGISVDPNFIQGIAGPVPALQAVTDQGATSDKQITVAGVVSTADQSESTFLHKDISQLPELS